MIIVTYKFCIDVITHKFHFWDFLLKQEHLFSKRLLAQVKYFLEKKKWLAGFEPRTLRIVGRCCATKPKRFHIHEWLQHGSSLTMVEQSNSMSSFRGGKDESIVNWGGSDCQNSLRELTPGAEKMVEKRMRHIKPSDALWNTHMLQLRYTEIIEGISRT